MFRHLAFKDYLSQLSSDHQFSLHKKRAEAEIMKRCRRAVSRDEMGPFRVHADKHLWRNRPWIYVIWEDLKKRIFDIKFYSWGNPGVFGGGYSYGPYSFYSYGGWGGGGYYGSGYPGGWGRYPSYYYPYGGSYGWGYAHGELFRGRTLLMAIFVLVCALVVAYIKWWH